MASTTVTAAFPEYSIDLQESETSNGLAKFLRQTLDEHRGNLEDLDVTLAETILIRQETGLLARALNSEGYYEHELEYVNDNGRIVYQVWPRRKYQVSEITISSEQPDINLPPVESLAIKPGMALRAETVLAAESELDRYLRDNNCLWSNSAKHEIRLQDSTATATVDFVISPSLQVTLADIRLQGLETIEEKFIRDSLELHTGQCYQTTKIEKSRLQLLQSGLFSLVDTESLLTDDNTVDVVFELRERHHKTIKAGIGYSTDESISLTGGWQHRNYFGSGERLDVNARVSKLFRTLDSTLTIPFFYNPRQALLIDAEFIDEDLEAYDAIGFSTTLTLRRTLAQHLTGSAGIRYQFRSVTEHNVDTLFGLASLPLSLEYDSRDDLLDPRQGWVTSLKVQPVLGTLDTDILFLKSSLGGSIYHTFSDTRFSPTIAARAIIGSIFGNDTDSIPADERFYGGGGGSVRGYPYQRLGPVVAGEPEGGRSLLEFSLEARLHFTEQWGGVFFIDGGNVFDAKLPEFDEGVQWAVGLGARYKTGLAPIRLDLAFPVNRRSGIDDSFQIYISLAQAF